MILWTPMQLELVLEGIEDMCPPQHSTVSYRGVPMVVEKTASGQGKIIRLLSTDPADYLKAEHTPGSFVTIC
ncbi:MAG: YlzJ-like family protein [Peptococcaceae bacterium]|nr:YlzJ-like family protein [Peptococcaceae bacterium]